MITSQLSPDAGNRPDGSSTSVPRPVKLIGSPTFQVNAPVGVSMTATGAELFTEMLTAATSNSPPGSVTRRRAATVPLPL